MSAGRCVTANHGFLGCSTDVLPYMDGKCSGRQKCKVYIAEPELHDTKPCPRDFASYLSAAYECIKGELANMRPVDGVVILMRSLVGVNVQISMI